MQTPRDSHFQPGHRPWNTRTESGCGLPGHDTDHFSSTGKKSCRECHLARGRKYAANRLARYRELFFEHYGSVCACCGEAHKGFLVVDHVDGGGNQHRKILNASGSMTIVRWLVKNGYPPGFRTLCHNCNFATIGGKTCPHETERDSG